MKTTMSITRALNELKLLDSRINKYINGAVFITAEIGGEKHHKTFTPEEDYQSIKDLIDRRAVIKTAIMSSNASTEVTIGDRTMTVVEAIELKDSINYLKSLSDEMINQKNSIRSKVENHNLKVSQRLDALLEANFGKDGKVKPEDMEAIVKPFEAKNKATEVDPLNLDTKCTELIKFIDEFENNVDFVLSESNAITQIDV